MAILQIPYSQHVYIHSGIQYKVKDILHKLPCKQHFIISFLQNRIVWLFTRFIQIIETFKPPFKLYIQDLI